MLGAAIAVLFLASVAAPESPYMVLSDGQSACGDFVRADAQRKQLYAAWALGYISGQNSLDTGTGRLVGGGWTKDVVLVDLQDYCTRHAAELFVTGVEHLRKDLAANPR